MNDTQSCRQTMSLASADEHACMDDAVARALEATHQSGKSGIAASVLQGGNIIAKGENEVNLQSDPTKHAEMVAITRASQLLGRTDLSDCVLVSTLQPCEMCLSAMRFAGIRRVLYAAVQANVAEKYFAFPHLRIEDFGQDGGFEWVGGIRESDVLHLYADGSE